MSAPTRRYVVTLPDGSTKTRHSHRTYTHAIAIRRGTEWEVTAFCGSLELAGKEHSAQQSLHARRAAYYKLAPIDEYRILPVTTEVS